jgi:excinuclease ABC subunit A
VTKDDYILIGGARQHNLKNLTVKIPRNKFVVITGISGSGKSTLAFDTIFAEGQRRYVESLSAYARQFLGQMKKPDVDYIEGLSPAISIDQKTVSKNPRSTVGTVTEIYDHLRLLYARVGTPHCPKCGKVIQKQTVQQIVDGILTLHKDSITILAPLVVDQKVWKPKEMENLRKRGFVKVRIDGKVHRTDEELELDRFKMHNIEAVIDHIELGTDPKEASLKRRLTDAVEQALQLTGGTLTVTDAKGNDELVSEHFACTKCGISFEELLPRNFSFNSPHGACPRCVGLGELREVDPQLLVAYPERSLLEGALQGWFGGTSMFWDQFINALAREFGFDPYTPFQDLSKEVQKIILYGSGDRCIKMRLEGPRMSHEIDRPWEGVINNLQRRYIETNSSMMRDEIEKTMSMAKCPECKGLRLKPEAAAVTVADRSITQVTQMSVSEGLDFFNNIKLDERQRLITKDLIKEIVARLEFLLNVGLGYLTLDRPSATLSGGEGQRIRLATQIGSGLVGVIYILDEPSIGLHQRDNARLIDTLIELRNLGNSLIVVEHDEETILAADQVLDLGPGAGIHGGHLVSQGTPQQIMRDPKSITGRFLSGKECIPMPKERREPNGKKLVICGAKEHNLKDITVEIPLNVFTCVTGVSGSGKSTLIHDILYPALAKRLHGTAGLIGEHKELKGLEHLDKVIIIDQSPIGRTPRSNPATYTGLFNPIRDLFALTKDAQMRGYRPGRFSFNVKGGRCEKCGGAGLVKIEMHFLPDIFIPCEQCKGLRFNRETLEVKFKDRNISEVLEMTVEEALEFFQNQPQVRRKLQTLYDVGLGYLRLGQPATTLSGGEAQRVKLSTELSKRATGKTIYLLDEPTTGLHFADIKRLLEVLHRLTSAGNTVLVIEHNMDVIKTADYIIDLGPEGGNEGGYIVAKGTPEEVAKTDTATGRVLKKVLKKQKR